MHILFANYQQGETNNYSQQIAKKLIQKHVDINHVDNNGLSPLHVAIKKS
jgi:ankyrin repeat protein